MDNLADFGGSCMGMGHGAWRNNNGWSLMRAPGTCNASGESGELAAALLPPGM